MKLTQRSLTALALPEGKSESIFFDDTLPGFGLRLRNSKQTFIVQYKLGPQHRRLTLGTTAELSLEQARNKARDILAAVRLGRDPASEKRTAVAALTDHCEAHIRRYLVLQKTRQRSTSYHHAEHHLLVHWRSLHTLSITKIDRRVVAKALIELAATCGPAAADRARAVLSAFFAWAIREGVIETNPVIGTNRPYDGKSRQRVLGETELTQIWHAAGNEDYGTIVKLLMLTGQRREEIGGLRWNEVDFTARLITLPSQRVKNGRIHQVPLSNPAIALLRAIPQQAGHDRVFDLSSYSHPKKTLDQRIASHKPVAPWVIHDLRRSVATHMAELGIAAPHIIEAILNHVSGHKSGVAGIYNRASYEQEKRQALDRWADHVMAAVEGRASNVIAIDRRA
jgi:integrase